MCTDDQAHKRRDRRIRSLKTKKKRSKVRTDDLVCPITCQLLFDPVVAEDGRIYERHAIEWYFRACRQDSVQIKSPISNAPMGDTLIPSLQTRNHIESLITDKLIKGELADEWKAQAEAQKYLKNLQKQATAGDARAMCRLAILYKKGMHVQQDPSSCFSWLERAHAKGYVPGTALLGWAYINGEGVTQNVVHGTALLMSSAKDGCTYAAWMLGCGYAQGRFGLPIELHTAVVWLKVCLDPDLPYQTLGKAEKVEAGRMLESLNCKTVSL